MSGEQKFFAFRSVFMKIFISVFFIMLALPSHVFSHDFWIEPSTFNPALGESVDIHLRVGVNFEGETVVRMSNWFDRFEFAVETENQVYPIPGKEWNDPAGSIAVEHSGLYLIGFQSQHQAIVIDPATFAFYLKEEGLDDILQLREKRGESEKNGNEIFLRCCKAFITSKDQSLEGFDRILGFKLEMIPQKNPLALKADEELPLQLLFMGKPVQNVLVAAIEKENPSERIARRTDSSGMVRLRITKKGHWLIKAVHMTEVTEKDQFADWQSFWASLVFDNSDQQS